MITIGYECGHELDWPKFYPDRKLDMDGSLKCPVCRGVLVVDDGWREHFRWKPMFNPRGCPYTPLSQDGKPVFTPPM